MFESSGTIHLKDGSSGNDALVQYFKAYDVHLVVFETGKLAGHDHYHYMVIHDQKRDALRNALARIQSVAKATCVDVAGPKGFGSWLKCRQYLCKGDPINWVSRSGLEFDDDRLAVYHEDSGIYVEKLKQIKTDNKRNRMDIFAEAIGDETDLEKILNIMHDVAQAKRMPWNPSTIGHLARYFYGRSPEGRRDNINAVMATMTYAEIRR